jgi:hypothetical protein
VSDSDVARLKRAFQLLLPLDTESSIVPVSEVGEVGEVGARRNLCISHVLICASVVSAIALGRLVTLLY